MTERKQIDDDVLQHLRALVEKSLEANTLVAQNSAEVLKQLSQGDVDLSELTAKGNDVLNRAVREYVRLSSAHASRLIDLGVDVSRSILASVDPSRTGAVTAATGPLFDLEVSGKPGAVCQTAFYMESDRSESMSSAFSMTPVVDASGAEQKGFDVTFEPRQVTMEPGTKERIVLRIQIPGSADPGAYHSVVSLDARPEKRFRLVVGVDPPEAETEGDAAELPGAEDSENDQEMQPKAGDAGASKQGRASTSGGAADKARAKKPGTKPVTKSGKKPGGKPARTSGEKPPKKPGR